MYRTRQFAFSYEFMLNEMNMQSEITRFGEKHLKCRKVQHFRSNGFVVVYIDIWLKEIICLKERRALEKLHGERDVSRIKSRA